MIEIPQNRVAQLTGCSTNYGLFKNAERQLIDQSWGNRIIHPPNVSEPTLWSPDDPNLIAFEFITLSFLAEQILVNTSGTVVSEEDDSATESELYLVSGPFYGILRELAKLRKNE